MAQQISSPTVATSSGEAVAVTLTAVGDIRLDGSVGDVIAKDGMSSPLAGAQDLQPADILFGNLECAITQRGIRVPKTWNFRAPSRNLELLKAAGFNMINIANNHVMDYGPIGFEDTLAALGKWGIPYVGGGENVGAAEQLQVVTIRGLRIGFLGFTSTFPDSAWATAARSGVAYADMASAGDVIRAARSRCDVLAVSFHGGTELAPEPNDTQKSFARLAIDSGADLFIGHHPHVIEPLEIYQGKPIIYSLGNFLFVSPNAATRLTTAARIILSQRGVEHIDFLPFDTNGGRPVRASADQGRELLRILDLYGALRAQPDKFRVVVKSPSL